MLPTKAYDRARRRHYAASHRAFYAEHRTYDIRHYGKHYVLNVCYPYCIIQDAQNMRVVGVMPVLSGYVLRDRYY